LLIDGRILRPNGNFDEASLVMWLLLVWIGKSTQNLGCLMVPDRYISNLAKYISIMLYHIWNKLISPRQKRTGPRNVFSAVSKRFN